MNPEPLSELLPQLFAGDPAAARAVFDQYSERLVRLADRHLSRRLAGRIDGEDIVQSVFRTFFRRGTEGEFHVDGSAQLWQLLVRITILKSRARARQHTAGKRNAAIELPAGEKIDLATPEPGPDEAAALVDEIEALLQGLPPVYGQLLGLRLQGGTVTDVADKLQLSRQTIHRALNLLQDRLIAIENRADTVPPNAD